MPIVHVMRHGHVHNPRKVLYGRLPEFRLSDAGHQMAAATAAHLREAGHDVRTVIASPLLRAQQTAQAVADEFGVELGTDERLIEAGNDFEGTSLSMRPVDYLHPRYWWRLRNPFRPSWGEPYTQQRDRMFAAVRDAAAATPEGEAVLVSHQLPIWVVRMTLEGRRYAHDPRTRECDLASLTTLSVDGDQVSLVNYANPAGHIEVAK